MITRREMSDYFKEMIGQDRSYQKVIDVGFGRGLFVRVTPKSVIKYDEDEGWLNTGIYCELYIAETVTRNEKINTKEYSLIFKAGEINEELGTITILQLPESYISTLRKRPSPRYYQSIIAFVNDIVLFNLLNNDIFRNNKSNFTLNIMCISENFVNTKDIKVSTIFEAIKSASEYYLKQYASSSLVEVDDIHLYNESSMTDELNILKNNFKQVNILISNVYSKKLSKSNNDESKFYQIKKEYEGNLFEEEIVESNEEINVVPEENVDTDSTIDPSMFKEASNGEEKVPMSSDDIDSLFNDDNRHDILNGNSESPENANNENEVKHSPEAVQASADSKPKSFVEELYEAVFLPFNNSEEFNNFTINDNGKNVIASVITNIDTDKYEIIPDESISLIKNVIIPRIVFRRNDGEGSTIQVINIGCIHVDEKGLLLFAFDFGEDFKLFENNHVYFDFITKVSMTIINNEFFKRNEWTLAVARMDNFDAQPLTDQHFLETDLFINNINLYINLFLNKTSEFLVNTLDKGEVFNFDNQFLCMLMYTAYDDKGKEILNKNIHSIEENISEMDRIINGLNDLVSIDDSVILSPNKYENFIIIFHTDFECDDTLKELSLRLCTSAIVYYFDNNSDDKIKLFKFKIGMYDFRQNIYYLVNPTEYAKDKIYEVVNSKFKKFLKKSDKYRNILFKMNFLDTFIKRSGYIYSEICDHIIKIFDKNKANVKIEETLIDKDIIEDYIITSGLSSRFFSKAKIEHVDEFLESIYNDAFNRIMPSYKMFTKKLNIIGTGDGKYKLFLVNNKED